MSTADIIAYTLIGIFTLFILKKKGKTTSDYLLLLINVTLALTIYSGFPIFDDGINGYKLFVHFNAAFWFVAAFLLYAYSLVEGQGRFVFKWWFLAFLVPFFLFSAYDLIFDSSKTQVDFEKILVDPNLIYHFFFKLHKIFIILVGFDILRKIKQNKLKLKRSYSYIENISLNWLRNYTILTMVIFTVNLIVFLLFNFGIATEIDSVYFVVSVMTVTAAFYLSFYGIQHYNYAHVRKNLAELEPEISTSNIDSKEKSAEHEVIFQKAKLLFETENTFTDPQLRIGTVAEKLDVPKHKLSNAINAQFGKPFYDFVASYRVELLKEKLLDPKSASFTILALALDAGFNSKASMNRIFKEQTGLAPSHFQKTHLSK